MPKIERRVLWAVLLWGLLVWGAALAIAAAGTPAPRRGHWDPSLDRFAKTAPLAQWDSYWYWRIAEDGYETAAPLQNATVFFPLYPMILAAIRLATGLHPFLAGTPLSLAALAGGAVAIVRLAEIDGFDPRWSLAALLLFPKAVFFAATLTESVFLLLSAACLLAARRGKPGPAAVCGFLAALTRPPGIVLCLPLAVSAWDRLREDGGARGRVRPWAAALAPAAGAAVFAGFLRFRFGSPFVGVESEAAGWGHRILGWPWEPLLAAIRPHGREVRVSLLFMIPFAIAGVLLWRRLLRAEALYVLGSIALVLETGALPSAPRYMLVLFPAFFVFGDALRRFPAARWTYVVVGASTLGLEIYRFTLGYWVA